MSRTTRESGRCSEQPGDHQAAQAEQRGVVDLAGVGARPCPEEVGRADSAYGIGRLVIDQLAAALLADVCRHKAAVQPRLVNLSRRDSLPAHHQRSSRCKSEVRLGRIVMC